MKRNRGAGCARRPHMENLENRLLLAVGADLALTMIDGDFQYDTVIPGDKGYVTVQLENVGSVPAIGTVDLRVFASTDTTYDGQDVLLGSRLKLRGMLDAGDDSGDITIALKVPATLEPGSYYCLVQMSSSLVVPDGNPANDYAHSADAGPVVWEFGNVGTRTNVKLKVDGGNGVVTFALSGPGTGEVTPAGGPGVDFNSVTLTDTQYTSKMTITSAGKSITTLDSIAVLDDATPGSGSIKSISGKNVDIESGVLVDGLISSLTLHDIASVFHFITLNAGAVGVPDGFSASLTMHSIDGCVIDTGGIGIKSFKLAQATGVSVTAPWMGSLTVKSKVPGEGNFTNGMLTLNSPSGNNGVALAKLQVFDALDSTVIDANASVKAVSASTWSGGSLTCGDLGNVTVKGNMTAYVKAAAVGSVSITGDCGGDWSVQSLGKFQADSITGSRMDVVDLGKMTVKGWIDDVRIEAGSWIGSITTGGINGSTITAGVIGDIPDDASGFDKGGAIDNLLVKGMKDAGAWVDSFMQTNVAAWSIGRITVANMAQDDIDNYFGVTAHEIDNYMFKQDGALETSGNWIGTDNPADVIQTVHHIGDYRVRIVNG